MCQQLKQGKAEEFQGEVKSILKNIHPPKPNFIKEEAKAIKELKKDKDRIILTASKEVPMVVMDREEYIKKSEELLKQSTYKEIPTDPTTKYKNRLINLLKSIKAEGGINDTTYRRLYPTGLHHLMMNAREFLKLLSLFTRYSHLCTFLRTFLPFSPQ